MSLQGWFNCADSSWMGTEFLHPEQHHSVLLTPPASYLFLTHLPHDIEWQQREGKSLSSLELLFIPLFLSVLCPSHSKVTLPVVLSTWDSLKFRLSPRAHSVRT